MKTLILSCRGAEASPSPSLGASMPDGPAAPSQSSMRLIGLVDQLSVHIWQDGDHRDRESEETIVDRSTDLASRCFSFSSTWCRSLLLSFSTCYLGILIGLEGAINCMLAQTSHQRTTSEKRTKALLPKCPLFGGSTVHTRDCMSPCRFACLKYFKIPWYQITTFHLLHAIQGST